MYSHQSRVYIPQQWLLPSSTRLTQSCSKASSMLSRMVFYNECNFIKIINITFSLTLLFLVLLTRTLYVSLSHPFLSYLEVQGTPVNFLVVLMRDLPGSSIQLRSPSIQACPSSCSFCHWLCKIPLRSTPVFYHITVQTVLTVLVTSQDLDLYSHILSGLD